MHGNELTEIATVAVAALVCGLVLTRLRQPVIVGYILAGVLLGPSGLGLVENRQSIALLAELGVLLLLFLIGMELSLRAFKRVWRVAMLGATLQIMLGLGVTWMLSWLFGWPPGLAVLLGFAVALSSTAVAIKMLEDVGELRTDVGTVAVGLLIAQDLAVVPMLLVINAMAAADSAGAWDAIFTIAAAGAFLVGLVVLLSRRQRLKLSIVSWIAEDTDLTAMAGLTICFAAAAISGVIGLSPAYGAFLAGLFLGNSRERPKMIAATQPIQAVFLMMFFLSIGLLLDLGFIWDNLATVLLLVVVVTVVKTIANIGILRLIGESWPRAIQAGTVLGQIGEFSFVLMAAGVAAGLINEDGNRLMIAVIALSLVVSPLWLIATRRLHNVAWRHISSAKQVWYHVFGKETAVVVITSGYAVRGARRFGRSLGARAADAWSRLFGQGPPPEPADRDMNTEPDAPVQAPADRPAVAAKAKQDA